MKKYIATVQVSAIQSMEAFPLRQYDAMGTDTDYTNDVVRYTFTIGGVGLSSRQRRYLVELQQRGTPFLWEEQDTESYFQQYYETKVKTKREVERVRDAKELAQQGRVRAKPGRKHVSIPNALDIHLKFPDEESNFIREQALGLTWQTWFNRLVREKMERCKQQE